MNAVDNDPIASGVLGASGHVPRNNGGDLLVTRIPLEVTVTSGHVGPRHNESVQLRQFQGI